MRKRILSGIRDLWIVLFCLMERTLLQIFLAVPVPVRMVLAGVLTAKYVGCLFCTSLSMTILTVRPCPGDPLCSPVGSCLRQEWPEDHAICPELG